MPYSFQAGRVSSTSYATLRAFISERMPDADAQIAIHDAEREESAARLPLDLVHHLFQSLVGIRRKGCFGLFQQPVEELGNVQESKEAIRKMRNGNRANKALYESAAA